MRVAWEGEIQERLINGGAETTLGSHQVFNLFNHNAMTKKETFKWALQIIASIATAILTALGTTSCMGV